MKKIFNILFAGMMAAMSVTAANPVEAEAQAGACMPESKICIVRQELTQSNKLVQLEMDFQLDSTYLKNMTWVSLTPVIRRDTIQKSLHSMLIMGKTQSWIFDREGVDTRYGDNYQIVLRKERSNVQQVETWQETFAWESWMDSAKIYVRMENCGCGKVKGAEEVAVRPINTPNLLPYVIYIDPEHQIERADSIKEYDIHGSAFINFVVDRWEVLPTYMSNEREIKKITDTLDIVMADPNITIRSIQIHGWASPEDTYKHNTMLATNRARALTEYIHAQYKLDNEVFLPAKATPENWLGLADMLYKHSSEIEHASAILTMIGNPNKVKGEAADALEHTIRQMYRADYDYMLANWYPHLRRSDYEVHFTVRSFTTTEGREVIRTKPYQLSLNEMILVAQTYEKYSDDYNQVIETAYRYYGHDHEEARLYMVNVALHQGKIALAEMILRDCGDSAAAWNARGIVALSADRLSEAREAFLRAQEMGGDVQANLDLLD